MSGEHVVTSGIATSVPGSSPRVRGTPRDHARWFDGQRIIPACAGNAPAVRTRRRRSTDHPRVCGERDGLMPTASANTGSSPRVRGTQAARRRLGALVRIIPACAGNAHHERDLSQAPADHPRVCGERVASRNLNMYILGSSPRVRGTRVRRRDWPADSRIIPACAGNASASCPAPRRVPDHPRVCGERSIRRHFLRSGCGSSPRVRGTRPRRRRAPIRDRIIPACAGNATRHSSRR